MDEYINKKEVLHQICAEKCGNYGYEECASPKRCLECQIIEDFPSADVAPVVHGRWKKISGLDEDGNVWYRCPICLHNDKQSPGIDVPYCWYCGARMDGTEDNEK